MAMGVPSFKVILCGEFGVGKSSIFRRFVDNSFVPSNDGLKSVAGLDHFAKWFTIFEGCEIELVLWDTAGIERFSTLSSSYFRSASVVIVCYSIICRESYNHTIQHILEAVEQSSSAKIYVCGTKLDEEDRREVWERDIEVLKDQLEGVVSGTFNVSSKTGQGVQEMFEFIAQTMHRQVDERFKPGTVRILTASGDASTENKPAGRCC